jgi:hypothetical protein
MMNCHQIGCILAPLAGTRLWVWRGLGSDGMTSALAMLVALILLNRCVPEVEV